jgi:ubiquinone biosynthesis protein COQ9
MAATLEAACHDVAHRPAGGYVRTMSSSGHTQLPAVVPAPHDWALAHEQALLYHALDLSASAGWGEALFTRASQAAGLSHVDASLLAPNGARDLSALLWRRHDRQALDKLGVYDLAKLKVRERIRLAVDVRIEAAMADEVAVRAASLFMARPANTPTALRLGWDTADALWRWAGDTATDENHYTKRAILSAVLASTLAVRLARGRDAAGLHLDARIAQVMAFEKWKAKAPGPSLLLHLAAAGLGRLRYGPDGRPAAD